MIIIYATEKFQHFMRFGKLRESQYVTQPYDYVYSNSECSISANNNKICMEKQLSVVIALFLFTIIHTKYNMNKIHKIIEYPMPIATTFVLQITLMDYFIHTTMKLLEHTEAQRWYSLAIMFSEIFSSH